jgi:hypothetical protein
MPSWEIGDRAVLKSIQIALRGSVHARAAQLPFVIKFTVALAEWDNLEEGGDVL